MAVHPLFTTGYAGCNPQSFVDRLRVYSIEVLVDIRRNPISRKRGFSKLALQTFLHDNDIRYVHRQELGVPDELRRQLRAGGNLREYFDGFRAYLDSQGESLRSLIELATTSRCCLMCLEADARECHRSVVTEVLQAGPDRELLDVLHI